MPVCTMYVQYVAVPMKILPTFFSCDARQFMLSNERNGLLAGWAFHQRKRGGSPQPARGVLFQTLSVKAHRMLCYVYLRRFFYHLNTEYIYTSTLYLGRLHARASLPSEKIQTYLSSYWRVSISPSLFDLAGLCRRGVTFHYGLGTLYITSLPNGTTRLSW